MEFGARLRELRKKRGLSQMEVVAQVKARFQTAHFSQTTLSAMENQQSTPRGDVLNMLAEVYHVPVTVFFEPEAVESPGLELAREYVRSLKRDGGRDE